MFCRQIKTLTGVGKVFSNRNNCFNDSGDRFYNGGDAALKLKMW